MRCFHHKFNAYITVTEIFGCRKKSENAARLKMKKMHGDKKRARKGGGRGADF
jgi:hypothetical protein